MFIPLFASLAFAETPAQNSHSMRNGFRMGYGYISNEHNLRSPHLFLIGYENTHTFSASGPLKILALSNISIAGINQGLFIPTGSLILGYQLYDRLQLGVGPIASITAITEETPNWRLNMLLAAGYTLDLDGFHLPLHIGFVPDIDNRWRIYATTGFSWSVGLKPRSY